MNNTNGFGHYVPPKPLQLGSTTVAPVASTASEFDVQAYVEEAASEVGLPVDSPQVVQAVTILKSNGFVSRTLLESLTEKIALDYLKLPIVVWVCLTQHKASMEMVNPESPSSQQHQPALAGRKRSLEEEPATTKRQDDFPDPGQAHATLAQQHQQPAKKAKRDAEETATAATVAERITQYCQEVGHDPAFFQVKSVNSVCCLVCNKTFKLHGRGQITRVKRHIKGEGKKGLSRHMHNLLSVKEKLRTQQLPMMWQIPVHILQQVQQACPSMASASAYAPPRGASSMHLLPNILPARGRSPSPSPSSATTSPGSSPLPSPASSSSSSTTSSNSSTPSTCSSSSSSSGLLHFPPVAGPAAAVAAAQRLRACAGSSQIHSGSPHFTVPLLSHAMAAVPSLEMLQAPATPSNTTVDTAVDSTTHPSSPPTMSSGGVSARVLLNGQRRQLDSDTGLVHCHCLAPAKPVLLRDAGASGEIETDDGDRAAADDSMEESNATTTNDGEDQPTVAGSRRFYVCPRRQSDEGCTFIKSEDSSFVRLLDDNRFEELDLHEASLQGYVDQNLVPDDDETGASVTTADYDDFATTNDEDDEEGGLIIDHDDFHPEDLDDVRLQLEAGAVESPSTSLVMAMISSSDDPSSPTTTSSSESQQHQTAGDDDEVEQEGQVEERERHRRQLAGVADDETGSAEMSAVELNEGGSEGIS